MSAERSAASTAPTVAAPAEPTRSRGSRPPKRPEVTAQQVGLVHLYPPGTRLPHAPIESESPQFFGFARPVGLWPGLQLAWQPPVEGKDAVWLPADDVVPAWRTLRSHALTSVSTTPSFTIYTIARMHAEVPWSIRRKVARQRRWAIRARAPLPQDSEMNVERATLDQMIVQLGIPEVDPQSGVSPAYYSHFDRNANTRGWLVVTPTCAVLAGVSTGEVATLATLLQPRDVNSTGILAARYDEVISRIEQWNGTQDVFEAVSQLELLVRGGRRSADGQVWLNFALAAIGVVLTLYASPQFSGEELASLVLLALASVGFAWYARGGSFVFQVAGWLLFVVSIAVTASVLLSAHVTLPAIHLPFAL